MTKVATVALLLQFDLGPHHGVAEKKFHHSRSFTHAESKKKTRKLAQHILRGWYVMTISFMSRQCHFRFRPEGDSAWKPRVIQGDSG